MNQPSEQAMRNMIRFFLKTSVPRILAKKEAATKNKQALSTTVESTSKSG